MAQSGRYFNDSAGRFLAVRDIIAESLQLADGGASLNEHSGLLGDHPEIDSVAMVTILTAIEEQFDFIIDDTDVSAETFATLGTLLQFVDQQCKGVAAPGSGRTVQPQFIAVPSGRLFGLLYRPEKPVNDRVIVLCPPFGEELNKARRQISLQARRFCAEGHSVLVFDLYGTGDSEGDFADASVALWRDNYRDVMLWLRDIGFHSCVLWAIRFGALFVADLMANDALPVQQVLLWQPELAGSQALRQFLRLQSTANILNSKSGGGVAELEERLRQGQSIEVAGYVISPALYQQAVELDLADAVFGVQCPVNWMHLLRSPQISVPERINRIIRDWSSAGHAIELSVIEGHNFWSSADIVVVPELADSSLAAIAHHSTDNDGVANVS